LVGDFAHDVRYAIRTFRRSPGFAIASLLTLTLGIGATTAVFSVVYGVLLRPLPYPGADRLVRVWEEHPPGVTANGNRWITNRTFFAWRDHARIIDILGGFANTETTIRIGADDHRVFGAEVAPAILTTLAPRPILGRLFTADEGEVHASPVVLLSEALWRTQFAADGAMVGRVVTLDGEAHTVVGVLSREFVFPDRRAQFWLPHQVQPVSADPALSQRTFGLSAIARLAPGVTAAQAEAEGTAAARSVPVTFSTELQFGKGGPAVVHTRPLVADMTREVQPALLVFAAAVCCVLLIACVNVANLCLARGVARARELTFRAALGAGRGRLARQLLTESLVLSIVGGALGVVFASTLIRVTAALAPARFPRLDDVRIDERVMGFAAVVSILTALLAGLVPALRGARFGLAESLRGADGATAGGFRGRVGRRLRDGLLAAESAFTVILLVGALLLGRSFVQLTRVDAGYTADRVVTARVVMPRGATPERTSRFIDAALARVRAMPGVSAAGAGNMMPMVGASAITPLMLPDSASRGSSDVRTLIYTITPGYAESLRLRRRAGRLFDDRDVASGTRAMIVNDEFVRRHLAGAPAIGRRFVNLLAADKNVTTEIVGVVGSVLKDGNDRQAMTEVYFVNGNNERRIAGFVNLIVRGTGEPAAMTNAVRQAIRAVDPAVSIERIEPLADQLAASMAQPRFATAVVVSFAVVALALASVGLYGVLAYTVSQRRRELGVRATLGASRARLVGLVLREGLVVAVVGVGVGLAGSAALTRLMQSQLFGVTPLDLPSFAGAGLVLLVVAVLACAIPAGRAAAIEPAEALRCE